MTRIALATMASLPDLHDSDHLLRDALRARGADVTAAVWSDESVDWASFDLVIIRSTWDYATQKETYLAWTKHVAAVTTLANPPEVVEWNMSKRYLLDLESEGVAIIPSTVIEIGESIEACPHLDVEHVVKPIVGAAGLDCLRVAPGDTDATAAQVRHIHATGRAVLIQPFVESVNTYGERDVICYDSIPSHTMHKPQVLPPIGVPLVGEIKVPVASVSEASDDEKATASAALDAAARRFNLDTLLYGRVDMVRYHDQPVVIELELMEPHMYFLEVPEAADCYAEHIMRRFA